MGIINLIPAVQFLFTSMKGRGFDDDAFRTHDLHVDIFVYVRCPDLEGIKF
jgi:hypothetical protein